jgi:hypothetical protein
MISQLVLWIKASEIVRNEISRKEARAWKID